jgi:hypothetical protein
MHPGSAIHAGEFAQIVPDQGNHQLRGFRGISDHGRADDQWLRRWLALVQYDDMECVLAPRNLGLKAASIVAEGYLHHELLGCLERPQLGEPHSFEPTA